jgi:hypothetical protein
MRALALRHEALADLTTDELGSVAGASGALCDLTDTTCVPSRCGCTGNYPSLNSPCETFDGNC